MSYRNVEYLTNINIILCQYSEASVTQSDLQGLMPVSELNNKPNKYTGHKHTISNNQVL
jgi:hypothetical protein